MVSKIGICNKALSNLGHAPVTSLAEVTGLEDYYDLVRRALLESHPWNFAIKRVELNYQVSSPLFGFDRQYTLPADFIRIIRTEEEENSNGRIIDPSFNGYLTVSYMNSFQPVDNYRVENTTQGLVLLSNDDVKRIIYVFDQTDPQRFSSLFVKLLAKGLSSEMAYQITGSQSVKQQESQEFEDLFRLATSIDGQQGKIERIESSAFLGSRA
jgi:hypothetical protein